MERSKYTLNGIYECENFAQCVENNNFPLVFIGQALGLDGWPIRLRKYTKDGISCVYPAIYNFIKPNIQVRAYFNIIKKDGSSGLITEIRSEYSNSSEMCIGEAMDVSWLMDEENGYLDKGTLTIEYGFQVEAEKEDDDFWMFNIYDKYFNWQNQDNTFDFIDKNERPFYGHKQIVRLHSKMISDSKRLCVRVPKSFIPEDFVMCLQITHGVRPQLTAKEFKSIAKIAFHFGFTNTVRYCEEQLIKINEQPNLIIKNFKMAVNFNMERYMIHLLIHIVSAKQLVNILSKLDLEEMSSESMKAFVAKYIRFDTEIINDTTFIYPFISSDDREEKIQVFVYFNILKKDGSLCLRNENRYVYLESNEGCMGKYMNIEEVLDEENGYLDEGALTVQYGLQANSVEDANGIWMFNCFDLFFDWQNQDNIKLTLHSKKISDSNKDWVRVPKSITVEELIMCLQVTHGPRNSKKPRNTKKISDSNKDWIRVPKSITDEYFVICLQIPHGVRPHITVGELEIVIKTAFRFGLSSTVRYCEQQLIKKDEQSKLKLTSKIKLAVKFNMERYLNQLVKQIKSPERLMRILKRLNIEKMSSESMKTFVGKTLVCPFISFHDDCHVRVSVYLNILKKDGSSAFQIEKRQLYLEWYEGWIGKYLDIEELLDDKNGYLDEGALSIEYGLQVESERRDEIWMFNFIDPFFDSKNMFIFPLPHGQCPIHCHKQFIELHSNIISDCDRRCQLVESLSVRRRHLAVCLQIAHGVRLKPFAINYRNVIRIAFQFGFFNTVRYCERQLIEMGEQLVTTDERFEWAVKYNMRFYLINLLKKMESKKQLVDILRKLDVEKMSSESMKAIVAKIFS
uniref:BTB domain-containing protein n=1 Tax=Caenorhabditis brenneri TaxID=135651 RepID=B6VBB6_CAEBE|nr:hypothetical protein Cbre_JD02.008 [Caenorhabditis brenneri]